MEGPVYPAAFARYGLAMRTPSPADRVLVDDVIFAELTQGQLVDSSRAEYVRIIDGLRRENEDERRRFLENLVAAIDHPYGRVLIVLTLRADSTTVPSRTGSSLSASAPAS